MGELGLLLGPPFVLTLFLVAIHSYLGLHVLRREVLFIDISLSQVSALGAVMSLFFFAEGDVATQMAFSLGSVVLVSVLLSLLKKYERHLPQEAIIGVTFAAASAFMILLLDRLPHGAEHLREAMVGNILFVTWPQVLVTFLVYATIAIFHYVFRVQFWQASRGERSSFLWDFLFYFLFGIVITFSTHHAGVLVVFSVLVVPAAIGIRIFSEARKQLLAGWIVGILAAVISFTLSYQMDFPAGPMIVAVLSVLFFVSLLVLNLKFNKEKKI